MVLSEKSSLRSAYTLAEVMVAASLMSVLAAVSIAGILFVQRNSIILKHHSELQTMSELALMQLEIDIQNGVAIEHMENDFLALKTVRGDQAPRNIRYWIDDRSATLYREEGISEDQTRTRAIMQDIQGAHFSYWDTSGQTEEQNAVRRIAFEALVTRSVAGRQVVERTVSASFLLRNFRYEGEGITNVL